VIDIGIQIGVVFNISFNAHKAPSSSTLLVTCACLVDNASLIVAQRLPKASHVSLINPFNHSSCSCSAVFCCSTISVRPPKLNFLVSDGIGLDICHRSCSSTTGATSCTFSSCFGASDLCLYHASKSSLLPHCSAIESITCIS